MVVILEHKDAMGKFWSGFRTLADGCRRLFKKSQEDDQHSKVGDSKEENSGIVYDSVSDLIVKVYHDSNVSEAFIDVLVKEIRAFEEICGEPKSKTNVKGTLLLRLSIDIEDITNVCDKLFRLSRLKVPQEQLKEYCINVSIIIQRNGECTIAKKSKSAIRSRENPETKPKGTHEDDSTKQNGSSQKRVTFHEPNPNQSERDDKAKNKEMKKPACSDVNSPQSDDDDDDDQRGSEEARTYENKYIDQDATNCSRPNDQSLSYNKPVINSLSNFDEYVKTRFYGNIDEAYIGTSLSDEEFLEAREIKQKEEEEEEEYPMNEPSPKNGGECLGINAEAVMRRLSRTLRKAMDESEWDKHAFTPKNLELSKVLENSFKTSGIIKQVQDEIASLKSNNPVWIKKTMINVVKAAEVVGHLNKIEFFDLHGKFPELVTFEKYVQSKEKQLMQPKIRRKYIAMLLYGALGRKLFSARFQNYAGEIITYDLIRYYINFCFKSHHKCKESEKYYKLIRMYKSFFAESPESESLAAQTDSIASGEQETNNGREDAKRQNKPVEGPYLKTRRVDKHEIHNDDEIADDERGNSDDVAESEEDSSTEDAPVAVQEEGKKKDGDGATTKSEPTYEETWTFEKDGINSLDDRIRTKRYGKGSKKRFENTKVKVKTRGVANRHIAPAKQEVLVEDAPEVSTGDDIFQICQSLLEDSGDSLESGKNASIMKTSTEEPVVSIGLDGRDMIEEPDVRHIESLPSTIIMGKKKTEMDDLGERYGATGSYATKANKQRRQRKKQQRASKVISLGDLNNSALVDSDIDDLIENCDLADNLDALFKAYYDSATDSGFIPDGLAAELSEPTYSEPRIFKTENILFMIYKTTLQ